MGRSVSNIANKKIDPIPDDMTIEEASEFWDTHSVADYPSRLVQLEYAPEKRLTFVAIDEDVLTRVEEQARKRGVSAETLVNLWIKEKVAS